MSDEPRYELYGIKGTADEWKAIGYRIDGGTPRHDTFRGLSEDATRSALMRAFSRGHTTVGAALDIMREDAHRRADRAAIQRLGEGVAEVARAADAESARALISRLPERLRPYVETVYQSHRR